MQQGPEEGDFEVRFSYNNVAIDELDSYVEGFEAFRLNYGGETTASVSTPIGQASFQAIGRGGPDVDFNDDGAFLLLSENFSSVLNPRSNFFRLQGSYNFSEAETSIVNGNRSFSFAPPDETFDAPLNFRFEIEDGAVVTANEYQMFDAELEIVVSGIAPSPVPLPATLPLPLPLLAIALGGLGFGVRRRGVRSQTA